MIFIEDYIYSLVYDYYETRILLGVYKYGEKLPSLAKISELFQMAPGTVRNALACLEAEGYIKVEARKSAVVIYNAERKKMRRDAAFYFVPRKEGITDIVLSRKLLVEPVWTYAQEHLSDEAWDKLGKGFKDMRLNSVSTLYMQAYWRLNNGMFLNFYRELLRYIRFLYLPEENDGEADLLNPSYNEKTDIIAPVIDKMNVLFNNQITKLLQFCDETAAEYEMEDIEPVPFTWVIYRQRPQVCYTLASSIIEMLANGTYPPGSYLPSLPQMSKQLGVSLRTLRRSIEILNNLGIIHSYHGKGTLVCIEPGEINFDYPEVMKGMVLHLECLEILSLTIRPVLLFTLENLAEEDYNSLTGKFTWMCEEGQCRSSFVTVLKFIIEKCSLATVRECYSKLMEFLTWGYPFALQRHRKVSLQSEYASVVKDAEELLKKRDLAGFAVHWEKMMEYEKERTGAILEHYCNADHESQNK